jgi:hypothetical protein
VEVLPYPIAYPLARFLSSTSIEQLDEWGRETFEAILTTAAYLAFAEHCTKTQLDTSHFKGFRRRSAGPLWDLFKKMNSATGAKWELCTGLRLLTINPTSSDIDAAVASVSDAKHGRLTQGIDYPRLLERLGNIVRDALADKIFGYFEDVRAKPFTANNFAGVFRNARGSGRPFLDMYHYEGVENFPSEFVFLLDVEGGMGLNLFPLFVRGLDFSRGAYEEPDVFFYDFAKGQEIGLRAVQKRVGVSLEPDKMFPEVYDAVNSICVTDRHDKMILNLRLTRRSR